MNDIRKNLIEIVEYCVDFISRDTKEYLVDAIEELFATDVPDTDFGKWVPAKTPHRENRGGMINEHI